MTGEAAVTKLNESMESAQARGDTVSVNETEFDQVPAEFVMLPVTVTVNVPA